MESRDKKPCRLLELPAELRNRVYRYTLVEESDIRVHQGGFDSPLILRACRQIRSEALEIFFYENTFSVDVVGCDSAMFYKLTQVVKAIGLDPSKLMLDGGISLAHPDWNALLLWLRRFHADEIFVGPRLPAVLAEEGSENVRMYAVGSMLAVIYGMGDMPWARVEEVLTNMRPMLVLLDARWGQD